MDRDVGPEWSLLMILSCQICLHIFLLQNKTLIGINMREVYNGFVSPAMEFGNSVCWWGLIQ